MRIAAAADLHFTEGMAGTLREHYVRLNDEADVFLLGGDLTNMGRPTEMEALIEELVGVQVPIVAVLGNHDFEGNAGEQIATLLKSRGVHLLDGERVELDVDGAVLGVAGVKGFCGGFDPHTLKAFGEQALKVFIAETFHEAKKLEAALGALHTDLRIALLHYSPVRETMGDEAIEVYPFLGSSLLLEPIERSGPVHAVFHGHAHRGAPAGRTPRGIPVYNVALPVLRRPYALVTLNGPASGTAAP